MLTDAYGRQSYMVHGVRSTKGHGSKLALMQPLFALQYEGLESSRMDLHRMRDVQSAITLHSIPYDIRKSTISLFMAETIYRLVGESEANQALFDFVWRSIEALDAIEEGVSNFHLWFLANMSRFLGFSPGNQYEQGFWFDIKEGIFTPYMPFCEDSLKPQTAQLFSNLLSHSIEEVSLFSLNREQRRELLQGLLAYYSFHLDNISSIKSIQILQEVF